MSELRAIFSAFNFVSPWAQEFLADAVGVLVLLVVLNLILKNLQTPQMVKALSALKKFGKSALQDLNKSMQLPVERPRLELVAIALFMANSYLVALVFFAFFGILWYSIVSAENLEFWRRMAAIAITLIFLLFARFFYAEAERQRLAVIEKWKSLSKPVI